MGAPVYPHPAMLLAYRSIMRDMVIACGVPATEVEDVTSTCLLAAWAAIERGAFFLYADAELEISLQRWLEAISWRLSNHERERARHRREVLSSDPWSLVTDWPVLDIEGQIAARDALRLVLELPPDPRELLIAAESEGVAVLARLRGITARAVRLRLARLRGELREQMERVNAPAST